MMTKALLIVATSRALINSIRAQPPVNEHLVYVDSVVNLVVAHQLQAFDTLMRPFDAKILEHKYAKNDTVVNDRWTRPKFVDNVYHPSFDGIIAKNTGNFDTLSSSTHPNFILFQAQIYDRSGEFTSSENVFLVKRNAQIVSQEQAKKEVLVKIDGLISSNAFSNSVATDPEECWINSEMEVKGKKYTLDSCQLDFRLKLLATHEFEQAYGLDTLCFTAQMNIAKEVGVEGDDSDEALLYYDKVQYCLVEHKRGFWVINGNELILYTLYGKDFLHFNVVKATADTLVLERKGYKVKMIKTISR